MQQHDRVVDVLFVPPRIENRHPGNWQQEKSAYLEIVFHGEKRKVAVSAERARQEFNRIYGQPIDEDDDARIRGRASDLAEKILKPMSRAQKHATGLSRSFENSV